MNNQYISRWVNPIIVVCSVLISNGAHAAGSSGIRATVTWENPTPYPYQITLASKSDCVSDAGTSTFVVNPRSIGRKAVSYSITLSPACLGQALVTISWKYETKTTHGLFASFQQSMGFNYHLQNVRKNGMEAAFVYVPVTGRLKEVRSYPKAICGAQEFCAWPKEWVTWKHIAKPDLIVTTGDPVVFGLMKNKWQRIGP
jgi:hypothetical protein